MRVGMSNGEWFTILNNMERVGLMKNLVYFNSFSTISSILVAIIWVVFFYIMFHFV